MSALFGYVRGSLGELAATTWPGPRRVLQLFVSMLVLVGLLGALVWASDRIGKWASDLLRDLWPASTEPLLAYPLAALVAFFATGTILGVLMQAGDTHGGLSGFGVEQATQRTQRRLTRLTALLALGLMLSLAGLGLVI